MIFIFYIIKPNTWTKYTKSFTPFNFISPSSFYSQIMNETLKFSLSSFIISKYLIIIYIQNISLTVQ